MFIIINKLDIILINIKSVLISNSFRFLLLHRNIIADTIFYLLG
jgi:hypothetical protein